MKIKNNSTRNYMAYDVVLAAGKEIETENKEVIKILLNQPGVEEAIDKKAVKKIEEENAKLKEELEAIKKAEKETKKSKKAKKEAE